MMNYIFFKDKFFLLLVLLGISSNIFSQTPGGVATTNMSLWLSGDDNVSDSGTLTWGDNIGAGGTGYDVYQPTASDKPTQSELFNFHKTFSFDGNNDHFIVDDLHYTSPGSISDIYAFIVYKTSLSGNNYNDNWSLLDFDRSETYNFYIHGNGNIAMSYNNSSNTEVDLQGTVPSNNSFPHIGTFIFDNTTDNEVKMRLDGLLDHTSAISGDINIQSTRYGYVGSGSEADFEGDNQGGGGPFDGEIAEIILFDKGAITSTEVLQIESYLALKYGISLDDSSGGTAGDYLYYNGTTTTTVWDASVNTDYHNNVSGLIRADNYELNQKISSAAKGDLIVATTSDFLSENSDGSRTSFSNDGDYLMFGDNGETSGFSDFGTGQSILRTKWLFKEGSNDTGSVFIAIPKDMFAEGFTQHLIVSTDDTFDGTDTTYALTESGDYLYATVNIVDGDRVSFITTDEKIAGVSVSSFDLLIRADDLVLSPFEIEDASFHSANAFQSNAINQPASNEFMNFNPTLTFDGTNDFLAIENKHYEVGDIITNLHSYVVYNTDFNTSDSSGNFDNWAFLDFDRSESYNMFIQPSGELAFSYQSGGTQDIFSASLGNDGLPHIAEFIFDSSLTNETFMKFDGNVEYNSDLTSGNIVVKSNRYGFIGDGSESSSQNSGRNNVYFEGQIAEVILADREKFTAAETLQVESYLAIKYGITLHNSLSTYKNSQATTIWDNATYWHGVAGIIKDDTDSDLDQRVAQSTSAQDIIIATDLDFVSGNLDAANRPTSLTEGTSLLFGNDGSGTGYTSFTGGAATEYITSRKWLFKEVGTVGSVYIAIPKSFFPEDATAIEYVISTNDTFDHAEETPVATTSGTGDEADYYYFNINISDGDRLGFTFTLPTIPSPGAFSDGLQMWIKSDKNVVSSTSLISSVGDSGLNESDLSQTTNLDKPTLVDDGGFNYNPSMSFDGSRQHFAVTNLNYTTSGEIGKMYSWVVYETTSTDVTNGSLLSFDGDEYFDVSVSGATGVLDFAYKTAGGTGVSNTGTTATNDGVAKIAGFIQNEDLTNATVVRLNGNEELANNTNDTTIGSGSATRFGYVGDGSTATTFDGGNDTDYFDGKIAEIIYYQDEELDAPAINRVESYLAIKYGIHLPGNYVNSAGTTIWNATTNAAYHNNVFGLLRDDDSELEQKQSKSLESNGILAVSIHSSIATTNAEITGTFSDLDYLLIGNDGGGSAVTIEDAGGGIGACLKTDKKINRDWKVSASGSKSGLTLSFDLSALPNPDNYNLLIDTDGDNDFDTGGPTENTTGVVTGNELVFTGITLADGYLFTLISNDKTGQIIYGNGVWFGGSGTDNAPGTGDIALSLQILDDVTLTEDAICYCMNVSSGASVTLPANRNLELDHILELDGDVYLYEDAQLVQTNTTGVNTGSGDMYMILDDLTASGYRFNYVSSPVNTLGTYSLSGNLKFNTDAGNILTNTDPSFIDNDSDGFGTTLSSVWFYTLNSAGTYTKIDEDTDLAPGVGFTMKGTNQSNRYNFVGTPNNGDVTALNIATDEYAIVGNPYPSAIDADDFNTDMLASNITDGTIYLWDQPSGDSHYQGQYDGGYATRIAGVGAPAAGVTGASTPTNVIKPGQGFVVTGGTTGGNVVFTNEMRLTSTSISSEKFFKTSKASVLQPIIRLGFEFDTEQGTYHRQLVTTPNGGTLAHDQGKDAKMFDGYGNDAYWLVENSEERYVITSVPVVSEDLSLDLGVVLDTEKEITFTLDKTESFTNGIYLLDKELALITNIREDDYKTTVSNGQTTDRFSLVFKEATTLDSEIIDVEKKTVVYIEEELIHIVLEEDGGVVNSVKLYDLTGREHIDYKNPSKTSSVSISTKGVKNKIMVLKVITTHGTFTKKIIL